MPIYAYRCGACGKSHDALQKMSDAPLTICPHCNEPSLTKQVTAAGFQLKGSGWYVTDFRNNGQPAGKAAPGETAADKAAKESGGGEKSGENSGAGKGGERGSEKGGEKGSDKGSDAKVSATPAPASSPAPAAAPASSGTTPSQG
jgi:putative FmdB family regulatory protein